MLCSMLIFIKIWKFTLLSAQKLTLGRFMFCAACLLNNIGWVHCCPCCVPGVRWNRHMVVWWSRFGLQPHQHRPSREVGWGFSHGWRIFGNYVRWWRRVRWQITKKWSKGSFIHMIEDLDDRLKLSFSSFDSSRLKKLSCCHSCLQFYLSEEASQKSHEITCLVTLRAAKQVVITNWYIVIKTRNMYFLMLEEIFFCNKFHFSTRKVCFMRNIFFTGHFFHIFFSMRKFCSMRNFSFARIFFFTGNFFFSTRKCWFKRNISFTGLFFQKSFFHKKYIFTSTIFFFFYNNLFSLIGVLVLKRFLKQSKIFFLLWKNFFGFTMFHTRREKKILLICQRWR